MDYQRNNIHNLSRLTVSLVWSKGNNIMERLSKNTYSIIESLIMMSQALY